MLLLAMSRKQLIRTSEYFYHVTTRSNHKEWFKLPLRDVWKIAMASFIKAQEYAPAVVSQFVLMSNHYHLLIRTPNFDIDVFMYHFNKTFSDELRRQSFSINRMFGSRYKWSLIKNDAYFFNVFKYIYQNPVRANIVKKCEDYPYSTYYYSSKKIELPFLFTPLTHLENEPQFINNLFETDVVDAITKGLKKTSFKEVYSRTY